MIVIYVKTIIMLTLFLEQVPGHHVGGSWYTRI